MTNGYEYFLKFILTVAFGYGIISYVVDKHDKHDKKGKQGNRS